MILKTNISTRIYAEYFSKKHSMVLVGKITNTIGNRFVRFEPIRKTISPIKVPIHMIKRMVMVDDNGIIDSKKYSN